MIRAVCAEGGTKTITIGSHDRIPYVQMDVQSTPQGVWRCFGLTPKQARKLARALYLAAKEATSRAGR